MKKFFRATLAIIMACVMLVGGALSTSATTLPNDNVVEVLAEKSYTTKYTSYGRALAISTTWKTIATSSTGFDCNVTINCRNIAVLEDFTIAKGLVRMLDKKGNVIWTSSDDYAVPGQGSYEYYCGSDVYSIQIKTQNGGGSAWISQ